MTVVVFDSGVGGLTVLREARVVMADHRFIYVGDDAGFPYGDWEESALVQHIVSLFDQILETYNPALAIIACNTASTSILPALRERFSIPFVGTVPAVKPAAKRTHSGLISVLGTPGTIKRKYLQELISRHASDISVNLVPATHLARLAEDYMQRKPLDTQLLLKEIEPCFIEEAGKRTDIVVLGCTHYPLLTNEMRKVCPWPLDWLDPAEAIANHAASLIKDAPNDGWMFNNDLAVMTSGNPSDSIRNLLNGFGLHLQS